MWKECVHSATKCSGRVAANFMNDEIIERLELKLAFLERANHELSDVVYRQQRELAVLQARVQAFAIRLQDLAQVQPGWTHEEEKPPHY